MRRFLSLILVINFLCMPAFAIGFDTSVDDEVRRNYNPSNLENGSELPNLPKILNYCDEEILGPRLRPRSLMVTKSRIRDLSEMEQSYAALKKGTTIKVKLLSSISGKTRKGTKISFVSLYPVSTTCYTLPMGTVFKGEILESHSPQFTGNGGLIVIKVNSVILNGGVQPVNAYITKVNSKNIFLNNIKGRRKYISSVFKSMKPGCSFFKKMLGVSGTLARDGSSILIAPFSLALGALAFSGNAVAAPALALFYKGESIYIPKGSSFEIRLAQDMFVY